MPWFASVACSVLARQFQNPPPIPPRIEEGEKEREEESVLKYGGSTPFSDVWSVFCGERLPHPGPAIGLLCHPSPTSDTNHPKTASNRRTPKPPRTAVLVPCPFLASQLSDRGSRRPPPATRSAPGRASRRT